MEMVLFFWVHLNVELVDDDDDHLRTPSPARCRATFRVMLLGRWLLLRLVMFCPTDGLKIAPKVERY